MKQYEIDTSALVKPALFLLLTITLISTTMWMSARFLSERELDLQQVRARLDNLHGDYRDAIEAGDIIRSSLARYRNLEDRGFIGGEQRLLWIESLRTSGNESRLSGLQYNLKQQTPFSVQAEPGRYYRLFASDMELRLDLVHEGRLLDFFNRLEEQKPAVYQINSCALTSLLDQTEFAADLPNLTAVCQLRWFTVRDFSSLPQNTEDVL